MALDAGTGSIRAVIFDLEGNQIAVGQAEWRHLAVPDVPGSMEFDLNKNWQLACECSCAGRCTTPAWPGISLFGMFSDHVALFYIIMKEPRSGPANVDARAAREVRT